MSELLDHATTNGDPDVVIAGAIDEFLTRFPDTPPADIADLIELARSEPDLALAIDGAVANPDCAFHPETRPGQSRADIHLANPKFFANFVRLFGATDIPASVSTELQCLGDEV